MIDTIWLDTRHAVQTLRRSPGFALVAIFMLTLGIVALATTVSLFEAIRLRTVNAQEPHRLVLLSLNDPQTKQAGYFYADSVATFRSVQRSFSKLSMYSVTLIRLEAQGAAVDTFMEGVAPEYFEAMGAKASSGQLFESDGNSSASVAVMSDRLYRRLFSGDAQAIGSTIVVDGKPVTIVGIANRGFEGLQFDTGVGLFVPMATYRVVTNSVSSPVRSRHLIGQLAGAASLHDARAEILARWPRIQAETLPPSLSAADRANAQAQAVEVTAAASGFSPLRLRYATTVGILVGLSLLLLTIGVVNLSGLLLARSLAQQHDFALRLALGAHRSRIVGGVLIEGLVLAFGALVCALPGVWWTTRELGSLLALGRGLPLVQDLAPGRLSLLATVGAAIVSGVGISALPAWRSIRSSTMASLRTGRTVAGSLGRTGKVLMITQLALSLVVLVVAGLFQATASHLQENYRLVQGEHVAFTRLSRNPGERGVLPPEYWRSLISQLSEIRNAESVALSIFFPAYFESLGAVPTDRYEVLESSAGSIPAITEALSPGFFATLGIPLIRGRDFAWTDDQRTGAVAIVNRSLANELFPGREAIGQRLRLTSDQASKSLEIVGIAADAPIGALRDPGQATVFRPMLQEPMRAQFPIVSLRYARTDLESVRADYSRAVQSQGHHFIRVLFTLNEWRDSSLFKERMTARLATFISGLTLAMACLGIYSMLAYSVSSRSREIGIRCVLGATRQMVVKQILSESLTVAIPAIVIGVVAALLVSILVRSQLYGVTPYDPLNITVAAAAFIVTAAVASFVPARRASRIEPMEAIKSE